MKYKNNCLIMIAEDDLVLAKQHFNALRDAGHRPMTANNLAEARWYLDKCYPLDAIFIDITLSDGCGIDLIPEIRKKNDRTRVIFLAAKNEPETVTVELEINGFDCIRNPHDVPDFQKRIANGLLSRKPQRAAVNQTRAKRTIRQAAYA